MSVPRAKTESSLVEDRVGLGDPFVSPAAGQCRRSVSIILYPPRPTACTVRVGQRET
jgi:hypothetical protein